MGVWGITPQREQAEAVYAAAMGPVEEIAEAMAAPETLGDDRLEHQVMCQAGHLSAAMCRWLLLVAEYDRREAYGRGECRSMAHWLEWKCGLAAATAREHVRVARAVAALPLIREAFSRAELSYSKVRALTRIAAPDTEEELVELAKEMTGSQLDRVMRSFERAARRITEADLHANYARRDLDRWVDADGPYWLLRPSPEEDDMRAVEYARDRDFAATRAGEYDDDELPSERYQVVLHLHSSPRAGQDGLIHLGDGTRLHPKTTQRLGCSATVTLLDEAGNELNQGRRSRLFTRRQRRALARQRNHCAFPHCDTPARWCDSHHLISWTDGRRVTRSALTHPPRPGFIAADFHNQIGQDVNPDLDPPFERADLRYITGLSSVPRLVGERIALLSC